MGGKVDFIWFVSNLSREFIVICGILLIKKSLPAKRIAEIVKMYF